MFECLLALRNDVGLLAEEYGTRTRRQMGNFPQAFSHVALVKFRTNLMQAPTVAIAALPSRGHADYVPTSTQLRAARAAELSV